MSQTVTAIIVTHNSQKFLKECIRKLRLQTHPFDKIIIIDSGSDDRGYIEEFLEEEKITVRFVDNIGFSRANNLGFENGNKSNDYVIFLNPDTFLEKSFISKAVALMHRRPQIGMLSGKLLGFDPDMNRSTGKIDSTGVFRKLYGRWYDRGKNEIDHGQFSEEEYVSALCGALIFCRTSALKSLGDHIFDPDFFLYKEDIELSIRLRKKGWKLLYAPNLTAYHCRGWSRREDVPYSLKKKAAESEILLYKKHPSPYIIWALLKYVAVVFMRI